MAVQTEISLPVMTGLIVTNQYLKSVCDKNAETCAELKQEQELLQRKCEEHVKDTETLKAALQKWRRKQISEGWGWEENIGLE